MASPALDLKQDVEREPLPLPARFGRYQLVRLIAVGGMAEIFLARSFGAAGFVKQLVIKRLDPALLKQKYFTELFINEAKLLVTLSHGSIVPVFDFGKVGDELFIAMEYVAGPSLRLLLEALAEQDRRLDWLLAAHIASEVCKGLDYAHRKTDPSGRPAGIVHRDIKPTNILLSCEGEAKIVDFGVAKLANRKVDRRLAGTLAYMAPEQANRQSVDGRTDVFATGLLLYEMLAGHSAYDPDEPKAMLALAKRADVPALPEEVPAELRAVVRRATEPDPDDRYPTAHAMEQDLSEYLLLARSVGASVQSVSPAFSLGKLITDLGLDGGQFPVDLAAATNAPEGAEQTADEDDPPSVSLLSDESAIDMKLIREAADRFQTQFLTRVLSQPKRALPWPLLAGVALLLASAVLIYISLSHSPTTTPASAAPPDPAGGQPTARGPTPAAAVADATASPDGGPVPITITIGAPVSAARPGNPQRPGNHRPGNHRPSNHRPPKRPSFGTLNLNSIPWSEVTVDGRKLPRPTPVVDLKLSVGTHLIVLRNRERKLTKRFKLRIRPGAKTVKVIRLR